MEAASPEEHIVSVDEASGLAHRQARLLAALACPTCIGPLDLRDDRSRHGFVVEAEVVCLECGPVGHLIQGRPTFIPGQDIDRSGAARRHGQGVEVHVPTNSASLTRLGAWSEVHEGPVFRGIGAGLAGNLRGVGVVADVWLHPASGEIKLQLGDRSTTLQPTGTWTLATVQLFADDDGEHPWSLTVAQASAFGDEMVVYDVRIVVPYERSTLPRRGPSNGGNGFPPRFGELISLSKADAMILDCGGGDRCQGDDRVFNMEYLPFRLPDIFADGLHLPFQDNTFDVIMSQAVLEHVSDPQRAVDEMLRILRPGGVIYVEIAFMQPLHAVPYHYFNVTPHGIAHLFREFTDLTTTTFGGLADLVDWCFRIVSAHSHLGDDAAFIVKRLQQLDQAIGHSGREPFAHAVACEASKAFSLPG